MSKDKIDFSKEGYNQFLNQIIRKIEEERDLALDRYRTQDEQMQEAQDFVVMGKNAASFLNIASNRTDALFEIAKQVKDITYKGDEEGDDGILSDEERRNMEEVVVKELNKEKEKEEDQNQEEDIKGDDIDDEDEEEMGENE